MFVWSKRLVTGLVGWIRPAHRLFLIQESGIDQRPEDPYHPLDGVNYIGLLIWVFVWMFDQARVRGKNVLLWLVPFALAPLPTLMLFVLFCSVR